MATCPLEECPPSVPQCLALGSTCTITPSVQDLQVLLTWGGAADADLFAVLFDKQGNALEAVGHCRLRSQCGPDDAGAVRLVSGDQYSGRMGERLSIHPHALPVTVDSIAILVISADAEVSVVDLEPLALLFEAEATASASAEHLAFRYCVPQSSADEKSALSRGDVKHMMLLAALTRRSSATREWSLITHRALLHGSVIADAVPRTCAVLGLPPGGNINFSFPLHMTKAGQRVALVDPRLPQRSCGGECGGLAGQAPFEVLVGVGWDVTDGGDGSSLGQSGAVESADIDLGCVAFNAATGETVDFLYWGKLTALNGALRHSGDNTTGEGDGIDEGIHLQLQRIPPSVTSLAFSVSHYNGAALSTRNAIFCVVKRIADEAELVRMEGIGAGGTYQSFVPCILEREHPEATWLLKCVSTPASGDGVSSPELRAELLVVAQDSWRKLVSSSSDASHASFPPGSAATTGTKPTPRESINLRLAAGRSSLTKQVASPILVHRASGGADPRQLMRGGERSGAKVSLSTANAATNQRAAGAAGALRDLINRVPFWVLAAVAVAVARLMLRLLRGS